MLTYADAKVVVPQANAPPKRWELQIKGAGKTAYSRSGDGRKLLRSSCLLHASYTPLTRLVHASYTPLTRLLHASYTPLTRLLHASSRSGDGCKLLRSSYTPRTCLLHASYTPLTRLSHASYMAGNSSGRESCLREFVRAQILACEAWHSLTYTPILACEAWNY
jgi:hypothetical protein